MSQLQTWCEKLKREVVDGVPQATRIRLMTVGEGTVWDTWNVAELEPAEWAMAAEALINGMKPELPKRRIQLVFIAESESGAQCSNVLRSVTGENPNAQDLGTQNGAKALADAMTAVQKLSEATLSEARKMLEFQSQQLDKSRAEIDGCHEFFMAIRKAEIENTENESAFNKIMGEQLAQAAPMLMTLVEHFAKKGFSGGAPAVAAAATHTNGVS